MGEDALFLKPTLVGLRAKGRFHREKMEGKAQQRSMRAPEKLSQLWESAVK